MYLEYDVIKIAMHIHRYLVQLSCLPHSKLYLIYAEDSNQGADEFSLLFLKRLDLKCNKQRDWLTIKKFSSEIRILSALSIYHEIAVQLRKAKTPLKISAYHNIK